jgi:hypothetical protein
MTTTNVIAAQSIGTSTNYGADKFPQKVTLTIGTTAFIIEGRITNGSDSYRKQDARIWYAVSSFDLTAAAAAVALRPTARYLDLPFGPEGGDVRVRSSLLEPAAGSYLYIWCDLPKLATAVTLAINSVELP